jgi:hypothetical protein
MISVTMRQNKKIHPGNFFPQALEPKLGRRINLNMQPIHHDMQTRPRALIPRVNRPTHRTITRNHRHPLRCARTHKNYFHMDRGNT